jgi:hypothetical protein
MIEESVILESTPPTPAVWIIKSSWLKMSSGGNRMTNTTEDINNSMHKNFTLDKLSLKSMYAKIMTNTVFRAIIAPTKPPFIPADKVALKATVEA